MKQNYRIVKRMGINVFWYEVQKRWFFGLLWHKIDMDTTLEKAEKILERDKKREENKKIKPEVVGYY